MLAQSSHPDPQEVASYYDVFAPLMQLVWDDNIHFGYWTDENDTSSVPEATDRLTDLLIEKIAVGSGQRVLDVGCGVGKPALRLATATGADVAGVSLNEAEVARANERAATDGLTDRVRFQVADALDLPFPADTFDAVWALESILHMDRPAALKEMARVLKPQRRLVLTDMFHRFPVPAEYRPMIDAALAAQQLTPAPMLDEYPGLVKAAGLDIVEIVDISAHTGFTLPRLGQAIGRDLEKIKDRFGSDADAIISSLTFPAGEAPEFGYLVLVAERTR